MPTPTKRKKVKGMSEKRAILHWYLLLKLEERDYHAVSDVANDLRELDIKERRK